MHHSSPRESRTHRETEKVTRHTEHTERSAEQERKERKNGLSERTDVARDPAHLRVPGILIDTAREKTGGEI